MLDFIGTRLQKSLAKLKAKSTISEEDVTESLRDIKLALLEADVNLLVVKSFIANVRTKIIDSQLVGKINPSQHVVKIVNEELTAILGGQVVDHPIEGKPCVIMMTGLQGSGKTTSTAKIAKHFMKKKNIQKPLLVAADIYRPAAIEQLQTLGRELQIEVFSLGTNVNPREIATQAMSKARDEGYDLVIVDTAGRLAVDQALMEELYDIEKLIKPHEVFFVADALSGQDIVNVAEAFHKKLTLTGVIITKLDSDARGGAALSIRQLLNVPIRYVGTGERVTNLELFHPDRMASRILGMGDVLSLVEKAEEVVDEKASKRVMNRMISGQFDLNDLIDQLVQMRKIGKMSGLLKMIPGMAGKLNENQINSAEEKLALFEILVNSMTKAEKKNPKLLNNSSRKERILKGSGRTAQEYNRLVSEFDRMRKQMTEMASKLKSGTFGR